MQQNQELRIIPLGGLGEVGMNMMLIEYDDSIRRMNLGLTSAMEIDGKPLEQIESIFRSAHWED